MPATMNKGRRDLLDRLAALRFQARSHLAIDGAATISLAAVALCLTSFGVDRIFRLPRDQRALVLAVMAAVVGALVWRRLWARLAAPLPNAELAREVERVHPQLDWRLVSAVQFLEDADPRGSPELAEIVIDQAVEAAKGVEFGDAVGAGRWTSRIVAVLGGLALVYGFPDVARTWFDRCILLSATAQWPKDTRLHVEANGHAFAQVDGKPDEIFVPRGADLSIAVSASGVVPSRATVAFEFPRTQLRGSHVLAPAGKARFKDSFAKLSEDVELFVRGGDDEVGPLKVTVVTPPWLEKLEIEAAPPAYTRVPTKRFGIEAGEMALPAGSAVTVRATCSKKLKAARLEVRYAGGRLDAPPEVLEAKVIPAHDADPSRQALMGDSLEATVLLDRTAAIAVQVRDKDDLGLERDVSLTLRAIPDAPPKVQLAMHGIGTLVTPEAVLPLELALEDDYGLFGSQLVYRASYPKDPKSDKPEKPEEGALPVKLEGLPRQTTLPLEWDLSQLPRKLTAGTFFSFHADATDDDPRGAKTTSSSSFALRVVTSEELLLDLVRRQHEQRRELEKLKEEEEKLVPLLDNLDTVAQDRAPKQQRAAMKVVGDASRALAQVVDEMKNNKILDERARTRLTEDVVNPLEALRAGELTRSRDLSDGVLASKDEKARADRSHEAATSLRACVVELDRIIQQMKRVADLAELIAKVREILKRERDLMDETKKGGGD